MSSVNDVPAASSETGPAQRPLSWQLLLLPLGAIAIWFVVLSFGRSLISAALVLSGTASTNAIWHSQNADLIAVGLLYLIFLVLFRFAVGNRTGLFVAQLRSATIPIIAVAITCGLGLGFVESLAIMKLSGGAGGPGTMSGSATLFEQGLIVLVTCLLGPFAEEMYFRGLLLSWLCRWFSPASATIVSAAVFSLAHLRFFMSPMPAGLAITAMLTASGLVNGTLAMRSRSLWPAIASHAAFNASIYAWAFLLPGSHQA